MNSITSVAIEIPPDYSRNLAANRQAAVLVMIDGSDSSVASQALAAANDSISANEYLYEFSV